MNHDNRKKYEDVFIDNQLGRNFGAFEDLGTAVFSLKTVSGRPCMVLVDFRRSQESVKLAQAIAKWT